MKKQKFLLVILSVLLLIPILSVSVSAFGWTAKVNSDYSAITWNGHNYIRVNGANISYVYDTEFIDDLLLPEDEYDLAGFAVGVVDKKDLITGESIADGDVLVAIASS